MHVGCIQLDSICKLKTVDSKLKANVKFKDFHTQISNAEDNLAYTFMQFKRLWNKQQKL